MACERHIGFQPAGSKPVSPIERRLCPLADGAGECEARASSDAGEEIEEEAAEIPAVRPRRSLQDLLRRSGRARGQDRRRLTGAALAGADSPRHIRERLGYHDDVAAWNHSGRRAQLEQRRTSVVPSMGQVQQSRQRGHPGRHEGCPPSPSSHHEARRTCSLATWQSFLARRRQSSAERGVAPQRTSAIKARRGAPAGVNHVPTASPSSAMP